MCRCVVVHINHNEYMSTICPVLSLPLESILDAKRLRALLSSALAVLSSVTGECCTSCEFVGHSMFIFLPPTPLGQGFRGDMRWDFELLRTDTCGDPATRSAQCPSASTNRNFAPLVNER